ncbi:MAG: C4-type zinc ribbon domain-containing protein [Thermodesulfovibrionales bacterium]|nr:C4-type zinc ribbon domain-containing protein [Thermodesulfovibrionales bacterium]
MLPRLQKLIELQELDHTILQRTKEVETDIPAGISDISAQSEKIQKETEKARQRLAELEKKKKQKERELDDVEEKIKKLKARTPEIKTNKEYQALLSEIEGAEKEKLKIEDEILNLMELTEEVKIELRTQEAELKKKEAELEKRKKELLLLKEEKEKNLDELRHKRSVLVGEIDPGDYELYMSLLEKGKGLAVTVAVDSICQGCYLNIPPQLYVEIKKNDRLIQCPQCKRILYWKPSS